MATGLYSGVSGLAIGVGLNKGVTGLWSGASGLIAGWGGGFNPLSLFASGEQGAWYDPSDLSTMFQDTAGTTPVTATGQTVARINDKSGRGNHATQATAASRPIYGIEPFGGRRNLLTYTEQFDNAAWLKTRSSVTPNSTTAPDGTLTADTLVEDATASSTHYISQTSDGATATRTYSIYAKANTRSWIWLYIGGANQGKFFNLSTGVVGNDVVGAPSAATIQNAGNGWYRCSITVTGTHTNAWVGLSEDGTTISYTGNGTSGAYIWGTQLELGSTATAYQRVTDQWNVTQAGVPSVSYLAFDGTDDWLVSATITPGIDKAQVFAGVRKLSDAATSSVAGTSTAPFGNNGTFELFAPLYTNGYGYGTRGTTFVDQSVGGFPAPSTNVITAISEIATDTNRLRANGSQIGSSSLDQGTGNYLAYPLYVGRRGGATNPFNGRIYQMIVRFGANLSAATITQTENYTAGKTGIYTFEQLIRLNTLNASGVSYNAYAAADSNGNNYPVTNTVLAANGTPYSVL